MLTERRPQRSDRRRQNGRPGPEPSLQSRLAYVGSVPPFSDHGNAERLVATSGDDLRYSYPEKRWYVWNERYWEVDQTGEVERRAKDTVRGIYSEISDASEEMRRDLARHALKSDSATRIGAMIKLASAV